MWLGFTNAANALKSIIPDPGEQQRLMRECFKLYELRVKSRLREPGTPNHVLLEREGRGLTLFSQKWREAIAQWDEKIARAAGEPPKKAEAPSPQNIASSNFKTQRSKS
jgi:hypothetical protein